MRRFQLRSCTLHTQEGLRRYADVIYPLHLRSKPRFRVELHGFRTRWTTWLQGSCSSCPKDVGELKQRHLQSPERAQDVAGFDAGHIAHVETASWSCRCTSNSLRARPR